MTVFLDLADVLALASRLLGDPPPIRDVGLLESAVARPRTVVFGVEAYETIWTKAAALLQSIVNNHALIDGNKRLGWLATAVFLELNDIPISQASNDDVYEFVLSVASGSPEFDEIAERLQDLINRLGPPLSHSNQLHVLVHPTCCSATRGKQQLERETTTSERTQTTSCVLLVAWRTTENATDCSGENQQRCHHAFDQEANDVLLCTR